MTFEEILDQAIAMLQRRGRVTYRTLKRQFQFEDDTLEDLKAEIIKGQRIAVDEEGDVLVWTGGAASPVVPAGGLAHAPRTYTPPHLNTPTQVSLDPLDELIAVAHIPPYMAHARAALWYRGQHPPGSVSIRNVGRRHHRAHNQALSINQQVALAAIDFLPPIITPWATHHGGFDRLAINDPGTRLRIAPCLHTDGHMQGVMQRVPDPLQAPLPEVVIHRLPRRQIME